MTEPPKDGPQKAGPPKDGPPKDAADDREARELSVHLEALAVRTTRELGDSLRTAFADVQGIEHKAGFQDLVTRHDRETEAALVESLTAGFPDSRFFAEESGRHGSGTVEWIVDPIDGTSNFVFGLPFFAISIAAAVDGRLLAGVVYEPMRDRVYSASLDGAWCDGAPMRSAGPTHDRDSVFITSFPGPGRLRSDEAAPAALEKFRALVREFGAVRRLGSTALALAYVASGSVGAAYASSIHPWDVAAGCLLVSRAGGTYIPLPGRARDHAEPWQAPGYLAAAGTFDLSGSCAAGFLDGAL